MKEKEICGDVRNYYYLIRVHISSGMSFRMIQMVLYICYFECGEQVK